MAQASSSASMFCWFQSNAPCSGSLCCIVYQMKAAQLSSGGGRFTLCRSTHGLLSVALSGKNSTSPVAIHNSLTCIQQCMFSISSAFCW